MVSTFILSSIPMAVLGEDHVFIYELGFQCLPSFLESIIQRPCNYPALLFKMLRFQLIITLLTVVCLDRTQARSISRSIVIPPFAGCGKPLPQGQARGSYTNVSIASSGFQRSYLVFIPPTYNSFLPTPLILSYHGGVRTALDQLQLDQLTNPEFNTVSMVVYPQGINVRVDEFQSLTYTN
jgi:hypothetical protein